MRQTFNVGFVCRKSKCNKMGYSPVEMTININGDRVYLQLPYKMKAEDFKRDMEAKKVTNVKLFTSECYSKVMEIVTYMMRDNKPLSSQGVKCYFINGYSNSYKVCDLFKDYLDILKNRPDMCYAAYKRYVLCTELYGSVCDIKKELKDVRQSDILIFKNEVDKKYKGSTAYGYISRLKSFFLFAINDGKISSNPFNGIRLKKVVVPVDALSVEDVKKIENTHFDIESTERVKDCFLFQCYTGLSYIDMKMLKREDICTNDNGDRFIKKCRCKTGVEFIVPLLPKAIEILERYDYCLPVISNQKMNIHLHTIGDICIGRKIHTHIGRHTAATMLLNSGVSVEVVAKVLGHSKIIQTQHYAKVKDNTVFDAFKRI